MADLITVGEILIDLTQTHIDAQNIRHYAANPGGAPANAAVAAARLGATVAFIGKVGRDQYGADLRQVLLRNGVDASGLFETNLAPTTQAVVSVEPSGERSFLFYRSPGADTLLTSEETSQALDALCSGEDKPKLLHFGSVSLTAEPSRGATLAAVRQAKEKGLLISYDPNYRESLWADPDEAIEQMTAPLDLVDILKISDEELPLITGTNDPVEGSRYLAEKGISLVMITLGGDGAFYRLGEHMGTVPGVQVQVADTNGAGDTFLGAMLRCLLSRGNGVLTGLTAQELEGYITLANRAASITCSRSGAIPAMPTWAEVTGA